jgi:pyruvate dehydrogenase E2 component (dihydrolipoamide acetyltransferase)
MEIYMPKMSDHMENGIIVGWLVAEGERVAAGQPIVEIETDKTNAEVESPAAGFIKGIRRGAGKGDAVPVGETIAFVVASADDPVPDLPALGAAPEKVLSDPEPLAPGEAAVELPPPTEGPVRTTPFVRKRARDLGIDLARVPGSGPGGRITEADLEAFLTEQVGRKAAAAQPDMGEGAVRATPFVRKRARELGIDLAQVTGSGPHGRISEEDLTASAQARSAPPATLRTAPSLPALVREEDGAQWLDLTKIQRVTGERMTESAKTVPQFNLTVEVDATNLSALRELLERGGAGKVSVTAILVKTVADVLRRMRRGNASFMNGRLQLHSHVNIGVAVGSEDGLLVPVIHDADQRSLVGIDAQLVEFREKASRGRFAADDLMGGTFTISNLGMFGIRQFNAIVNPPESGILAVGEIVYKPICLADRSVAVRPTMMMTLTVDHRSLDGLVAAELLRAIKEAVEQPLILFQDQLFSTDKE